MLPDLRSLKQTLADRLCRQLEERALRHAPLLAEVKGYHQNEGDRFSYEDHEGEIHRQTFKVFRSPVTTRILPSPIEQEQEVGQKLDEAAQDVAKQHMQLLFTTVTESSQKAGTAYDAGGRPFDMGMFLDALEGMSIDFDEKGRPVLPTIVMHPSQMKVIGPKIEQWEKDRTLRARWDEVIAKKKEEWRADEASRKLVG